MCFSITEDSYSIAITLHKASFNYENYFQTLYNSGIFPEPLTKIFTPFKICSKWFNGMKMNEP